MSRPIEHRDIRKAVLRGTSPQSDAAAERIAASLIGDAMDRLSAEFVFATQDNDNDEWRRLKRLVLPAMRNALNKAVDELATPDDAPFFTGGMSHREDRLRDQNGD